MSTEDPLPIQFGNKCSLESPSLTGSYASHRHTRGRQHLRELVSQNKEKQIPENKEATAAKMFNLMALKRGKKNLLVTPYAGVKVSMQNLLYSAGEAV